MSNLCRSLYTQKYILACILGRPNLIIFMSLTLNHTVYSFLCKKNKFERSLCFNGNISKLFYINCKPRGGYINLIILLC